MIITSTEEKSKEIVRNFENDITDILKLFPERVLSMKTFEGFIKNSIEKYGFDYVKGTSEYTVMKNPKSYKSYLSKALDENWADEYLTNKKTKENKKITYIEKEEIEEAKIIQKYSYEYFENLPSEVRESIESKVYAKFLEESNSQDNKTMRIIFEKSKKAFIVAYINENEPVNEEKNKNICSDTFVSITTFAAYASKVLKERNIEFDLINVMEIFKIFKEYEDVNFKILYEDEKNIGTIILKGDK